VSLRRSSISHPGGNSKILCSIGCLACDMCSMLRLPVPLVSGARRSPPLRRLQRDITLQLGSLVKLPTAAGGDSRLPATQHLLQGAPGGPRPQSAAWTTGQPGGRHRQPYAANNIQPDDPCNVQDVQPDGSP
jgi:hypothetical protein